MIEVQLNEARQASRELALLRAETIDALLVEIAAEIRNNIPALLAANAGDLKRMSSADPKYDRLLLTEDRLLQMAEDVVHVSGLKSPAGRVLEHRILENGLELSRIAVPFGVIGVVYEARPNVSIDVSALCLKAKSACVLKGGSDADESNRCIVSLIHQVLKRHGLPTAIVTLLPSSREATQELLHARGMVDLLIPRGSSRLIDYVRQEASIPVIETGAGVVHCYVDKMADVEKATRIVLNAKTRRVSVCNALDCLIIHEEALSHLAQICQPLAAKQVIIYADAQAYAVLQHRYPEVCLFEASAASFGTEYLDYKMAIRTVKTMEEALEHINRYGSGHSESIVSEDVSAQQAFLERVDAACVYANAPTSFTDGAQFGLGAEIGISTQKLHARGPMALEEICTYKWIIRGNGQVRP